MLNGFAGITIRDGKHIVNPLCEKPGLDHLVPVDSAARESDIALRVARSLVLYLQRSAGQSQFSTALAFQKSSRIPLRALPIWILEDLSDDLSVERLADRAAMSVRNFSRAFTGEYGVTPARFVERLRVETAERLMIDSEKSVKEIAAECGFGSPDTLRRALKAAGSLFHHSFATRQYRSGYSISPDIIRVGLIRAIADEACGPHIFTSSEVVAERVYRSRPEQASNSGPPRS